MRLAFGTAAALLLTGSVSLSAQWGTFKDPSDVTVEDSKALTKPFTVRINQRVMPDDEPIEFVCNENQQFRRRIKVD